MKTVNLYNRDCLEVMDDLIKNNVKIDAIITDPPYGTTACKWDSVIDFKEMWKRLNLLIKSNGAIVLFGNEPFSSALRMSNIQMFRYDWVWDKQATTGFLNSNSKPLSKYENIMVFSHATVGSLSKNNIIYYPQGIVEINKIKKNNKNSTWRTNKGYGGNNKLNSDIEYKQKYTNHPVNIIKFKRDFNAIHPTQKPVKLMEYLIQTYTKENETVLDFTMGSGSTAIACLNTNRKFIGIEKEKQYFELAKNRIDSHKIQPQLF